jgi:hypothetical protein
MEIKKAEWPERSCREPVHGRYQAYACEMPDLHKGPCVSLSVRDSITRREMWEAREAAEAPQTLPDNDSEAMNP